MFKKILVPIDLDETELARSALAVAVEIANVSEGELRVINVEPLTPSMYRKYAPPDYDAELRRSLAEQMADIASDINYSRDRISTIFRFGSVYHEVLSEAEAWDADLIIVGSHRPSMATYLIGSNAKTIVRHAKCCVLVVRTKPVEDAGAQ